MLLHGSAETLDVRRDRAGRRAGSEGTPQRLRGLPPEVRCPVQWLVGASGGDRGVPGHAACGSTSHPVPLPSGPAARRVPAGPRRVCRWPAPSCAAERAVPRPARRVRRDLVARPRRDGLRVQGLRRRGGSVRGPEGDAARAVRRRRRTGQVSARGARAQRVCSIPTL